MENHLCGLVVPSKVAGVLGAGRPCLFLGPATSEAGRLILEQDFGEVLSRPTGGMLAARLTFWMQRPNLPAWTTERAAAVAPVVSVGAAVKAFSELLNQLEKQPSSRRSSASVPLPLSSAITPLPTEAANRTASAGDSAMLSRARMALPRR
jgi:hypothetical protein